MRNNQSLEAKIVQGPSYDFHEAIGDVTVFRERLPFGFVSESLRATIRNWAPEVPIAIFSDMGSGKNYFVENVLVSDAQLHKQGVLIIGNRVALGRQMKRRLAKMFKEEWKLNDYSDQGVDGLTDFGNITVVSYQQLETWINQNSSNLKILERMFRYVIMDEIHYCLADCSFNAMTDIVLDFITNSFLDAIKIYMTATPEQIFPILVQKEARVGVVYDCKGCPHGLYKWHVYQFAHNFEQITPHAFHDIEDVLALIKKTDTKEKTVIFVESKEVGLSIIQRCGFGNMITAESKNPQGLSYEVYMDIVKNEKFEGQLLVCTAVLENGVNLKDSRINKVVIFSNDKDRFLQMLGRIRREPGQLLDLYMQNEDMCSISYRIEALNAQSTALRMYYADKTAFCSQFITDNNPRAKVRGTFTVMKDGSSHINKLREIQIEYFGMPFWIRIKELIEQGDKYALLREKFSWIEKEFTQEDMLRGKSYERALTQLVLFLDSKAGQELSKDNQEEFKRIFSEKYRAVYGKREEDKTSEQIYGLVIIKECLVKSELPYEVFNERGFWIVKRATTQEN